MPDRNPSAPHYNPEYWNDFSWMHLNFVLADHHPEILQGLQRVKVKATPNNIHSILKNYQDSDIAIGLKVTREQAGSFRDTVNTLMQARQLSTNCYCHASNDSGPFPPFTKPWPGMISGMTPSDGKSYNTEMLTACVEADGGIALGLQPEAREGYYRVYMFIRNDDKEVHFVRENENGEYSHKTALGPVSNLDASDNIITDPATADMGDYILRQIFLFPEGGLTVGIPKDQRPERTADFSEFSL